MLRSMLNGSSDLRRLIRPIRPQLRLMSLAIISEVLRQVSGISVAVIGATLFAMAVSGATMKDLYPYAAAMVVLGLTRGSFGYLGPYLAHVAAYRILVSLRDEFYRVIEPLAPAKLSMRRTGDLVSTAVSDIEMLELFFAHTAGPTVAAIVVPLLSLLVLAVINLKIAVVLLIFLILLIMMPRLAFWLGSSLGGQLRTELALVNSQVLDSLQGMREILAFGYERERLCELSLNSKNLERLQAKQARNTGLQSAVGVIIVSTGIVCVLLSTSALVSRGELSQRYLPIAVILASSVFISMTSVVEISKQLSQTFAGARRLFRILDEVPEVEEMGEFPVPYPVEPSVAFVNVNFGYDLEGPLILKDLSFDVPSGSRVAIVGMSGAGKSTVVSLLMRFWDPLSGKILLNGRDLKIYPLQVLRKNFSVVSQDIFLFNDTIRENIRLGKAEATDSDVETAAVKAMIHDFILSLPQGYDTLVGERGIRLSGGERQRIAIARALLKDAPILILDEATSSLDAESERAIKNTITAGRNGRTTITIAHRLSTVLDADVIFVMDEGKIIEHGKHEDLMALQGKFAQLVVAHNS